VPRCRRLLLLVRDLGPLETHLARQHFVRDLLERPHHLIRAVAAPASDDVHGAEQVETIRELRTMDTPGGNERRERDHLACVVPHVVIADVAGPLALVAVCLEIDLPLAAESVELVDECAAEERLHGL